MLKLFNQSASSLISGAGRLSLQSHLPASAFQFEQKRHARNTKPWIEGPKEDWKKGIFNYMYRKARGRKIAWLKLPDIEKLQKEAAEDRLLTPEEMRSKLKEAGVVPHRHWDERSMVVTTSGTTFNPYEPPEGDGQMSFINTAKKSITKTATKPVNWTKSQNALRHITRWLPMFDPASWAMNESLKIYEQANQALANRDMESLHDLVTETCLPDLLFNTDLKTIRWKLVKSLEIPQYVHLVHQKLTDKTYFGQITVRFHTQQTLAVYDRHGRLVHGSEAILKDVLEYVVFEFPLHNTKYGKWRIHAKIIPEWMDQNLNYTRFTSVKPKEKDEKSLSSTVPGSEQDAALATPVIA